MLCNRYVNIVRYWVKILESNGNEYVKKVYNMMLNDLVRRPYKINWASLVRDTLNNLGFQYVWLAQTIGNAKIFLSVLNKEYTTHLFKHGKPD